MNRRQESFAPAFRGAGRRGAGLAVAALAAAVPLAGAAKTIAAPWPSKPIRLGAGAEPAGFAREGADATPRCANCGNFVAA